MTYDSDIFVAGCGIAGAATSIFAREQGLSVIQAGSTAEIIFASGLFDVYGSEKPFDSIRAIKATSPLHPYAKIGAENARLAMDSFLAWFEKHGMPFKHLGENSSRVITPIGTTKLTWAVPESFSFGVQALEQKLPALLVDFHGFREYSARQIMEVLKESYPGLTTLKVVFPSSIKEPLLAAAMAQSLEVPEHLEALASSIKPHIGNAVCVGLPAVLGIHNSHLITRRLSELLEVPVFEIPTLPASVPGFRLKDVFDSSLDKENIQTRRLVRAVNIEKAKRGTSEGYEVTLKNSSEEEKLFVKKVVLATGRFIGSGLVANRLTGIHEGIMDLPVHQPESRDLWHNENLFNKNSHSVNYAGVMVNDSFNPVDHSNKIIDKDLYAVGTLLAHHDWMREKCGVGLAVSSSYVAVQDIVKGM